MFIERALVDEARIRYYNLVTQDPRPGNPMDPFRNPNYYPDSDIEPDTCLDEVDGPYNLRKRMKKQNPSPKHRKKHNKTSKKTSINRTPTRPQRVRSRKSPIKQSDSVSPQPSTSAQVPKLRLSTPLKSKHKKQTNRVSTPESRRRTRKGRFNRRNSNNEINEHILHVEEDEEGISVNKVPKTKTPLRTRHQKTKIRFEPTTPVKLNKKPPIVRSPRKTPPQNVTLNKEPREKIDSEKKPPPVRRTRGRTSNRPPVMDRVSGKKSYDSDEWSPSPDTRRNNSKKKRRCAARRIPNPEYNSELARKAGLVDSSDDEYQEIPSKACSSKSKGCTSDIKSCEVRCGKHPKAHQKWLDPKDSQDLLEYDAYIKKAEEEGRLVNPDWDIPTEVLKSKARHIPLHEIVLAEGDFFTIMRTGIFKFTNLIQDVQYRVDFHDERLIGASYDQLMIAIESIFKAIQEAIASGMKSRDLFRLTIEDSVSLDSPILYEMRAWKEVSLSSILNCIETVLQSKKNIKLDEGFMIKVGIFKWPRFAARMKIHGATRQDVGEIMRLKHSVINMPNDDHLCLSRSIIVAFLHKIKIPTSEYVKQYSQYMRQGFRESMEFRMQRALQLGVCPHTFYKIATGCKKIAQGHQRDLAIWLCNRAGVDSTRAAGLNDIVKFEEVLNVRIHVVVIDSRFHFITPPMKPDDKRKSIYVAVSMADTLNFEEGHAYPAVFPAALFDAPYFCH